jgi:hypothetical protein
MIKGTLDTDEMRVVRITADFLLNPLKVDVMFGFTNTRTGRTPAFANATSGVWSPATMEKLKELCESMEADMARVVLSGGASSATMSPKSGYAEGGLGEHVGAPVDAPSV